MIPQPEHPPASRSTPRQRHAAKLAATALCLSLFALILTKSMLAYLAATNPRLVAILQSSSPAIRFALANQAATEGGLQNLDASRKQQIRDWTSSALRDEPFNARGLEMMGLLAASDADTEAAQRYMSAAVRQTLRRQSAVYWNLQSKLAARDYTAAADYADALLRANPQSMPIVISTLATMAEIPSARDALEKRLADNPPWRWSFFWYLKGHIRNPYAPLKSLLALKASAHPPTSREIGAYLRILLDNKLYRFAYYSWLQFLNPTELARTGLLNNGAFNAPPSGLPYDWTITSGDGATIEILSRDDRPTERALAIELGPGRVDFHPVSQLLALTPGRYALSGMFKASIRGSRGLRWKIRCLPNAGTLAETEMFLGDHRQWTRFTVAFEVAEKCVAQTFELVLDARSASETMVTGFAQFDELAISRN